MMIEKIQVWNHTVFDCIQYSNHLGQGGVRFCKPPPISNGKRSAGLVLVVL